MTTTTAGFTITGEFVTEHGRNLMVEDAWEEGYRFLTENVHGIDHEIAILMLKGEKRLTGEAGYGKENTLALEDESPEKREEIETFMAEKWSGIIRFRPDYWRPYAYVDNWGPRDVGSADKHHNTRYVMGSVGIPLDMPGPNQFTRWTKSRSCAYMNDPKHDRVEAVKLPDGRELGVLFERVSCPPIWWKPLNTVGDCWSNAVIEFEKVCSLGVRGHNQMFGDEDDRDSRVVKIANTTDERLAEEDEDEDDAIPYDDNDRDSFLKAQMASQMAQFGIDPEAVAGTIDHIMGNADDSAPTPDDPKDHNYGWILPDGKFYGCMYHHHAELAGRIYKHIMGEEVADPEKKAEMEDGWMILTKSVLDGKYRAAHFKRLTREQRTTFEDWCVWHHQDADELLMHER